MSKKPQTFERKGDWPRKGGSFHKLSDGGLRTAHSTQEAEISDETPSPAKSGGQAKDSGK